MAFDIIKNHPIQHEVYVFPAENNKEPLKTDGFSQSLSRLLDKVTIDKLVPRDLRRTFKMMVWFGFVCVSPSLTWVNTMIGNVKRSINGTYHAIDHKHLPRYLAEFCYRFNRRFVLEDMLPRLCYVALQTPPMPMRLLKMAGGYG